MKQDLLASIIGDDVARALKIPVDAIKYFDDEAAISIIANIVNNNDNTTGNSLFSYYPTFNPIEKEKVDLMKDILEKINQ